MEWISVKDRLPEKGYWVIFFTWSGMWIGSFWISYWKERNTGQQFWPNDVTHWMPLPEPPKE